MSDLIDRLRDPKTEGACWCCQSAADEIERQAEIINKIAAFVEHRYQTRTAKEARDYIKAIVSDNEKNACPRCGETDPDKHEAENLDCEIVGYT